MKVREREREREGMRVGGKRNRDKEGKEERVLYEGKISIDK